MEADPQVQRQDPNPGAVSPLTSACVGTLPAELLAVFVAAVCPQPRPTWCILHPFLDMEHSSAFLSVLEAQRPGVVGVPQLGWQVQVPSSAWSPVEMSASPGCVFSGRLMVTVGHTLNCVHLRLLACRVQSVLLGCVPWRAPSHRGSSLVCQGHIFFRAGVPRRPVGVGRDSVLARIVKTPVTSTHGRARVGFPRELPVTSPGLIWGEARMGRLPVCPHGGSCGGARTSGLLTV